MWKVPLFDLNYDDSEIKAVKEVLENKWLSAGPKVKEFETQFADYLGEDIKCCAIANCTSALHISLLVSDIKKGDEVILSGLTFIAALNVVTYSGATPVLADCKSYKDWNVSVSDISSKITKKTRAIMIVHFAGYPCDMSELIMLAKDNNIILIEDVAHAIGAEYKGRKCGTFGDIACFSFFANKNLSTGEGGMFVTKSEEFLKRARLLLSHGMTSMTIERHAGRTISYDVIEPGFNYRMDEIRAALGIAQLSKLDEGNKKRNKLVKEYVKKLKTVDALIIPFSEILSDRKPACHIFPVLLPEHVNRKNLIEYLKGKGIQTSIHYPAFNQFSYYRDRIKENLIIANEISNRVVTLPLYPGMTVENLEFVVETLKEGLRQ
jgi:dTDP-4-amino-4,6-dideoxygalactose transaminase